MCRSNVRAGLPAMQTTRSIGFTAVMLSQASQLPHKPAFHRVLSVGYCAAGSRNRAITGRWLEIRSVSSCRTLASTRLILGL
ncbi:hypothetical protein C7U57_22250 [Pseudomonas sp. R9.37]|nr:hypothetical protein C7U57_22250 [Pseudomonas sp. R9.37]